ncbi:hypothetical protein [Bacillus sp. J33]|uniref:hypothetical protein n=1 Tax=Bacillus sp. J33 TaxID=935836 RepID=UPI00047D65B8|nr:hypothetical protein [Bacillus sp. J33]
MQVLYGIEANFIIEEVPEFIEFIANKTELFDYRQRIFFFEKKEHAEYAKGALIEAGLFEESLKAYYIESGVKGETFDDFGIEMETGYYLFSELLCLFSITHGSEEEIQMAKYQFQEHIVFTAKNNSSAPVYFSELHLRELINGIADAYDIQVSFLDLDK